jgi:hypothetical protein
VSRKNARLILVSTLSSVLQKKAASSRTTKAISRNDSEAIGRAMSIKAMVAWYSIRPKGA